MKRIILAALLGASAVSVGSIATAGQQKVSVCHDGDNGTELISIAEPALDAHIAHGDAQPGDPAPGGGTYAEDCTIIPPAPLDTDGDGILDANDDCPTDPGPASNNGCPISQPQPITLEAICSSAYDGIFTYDTAPITCTYTSPSLDGVSAYEMFDWFVDLSGWFDICNLNGGFPTAFFASGDTVYVQAKCVV